MPPVSSNHCHVHSIPGSHSYYNFEHQFFPLLLKTLSSRSAFPLSLRATRVAFFLLKQFPSELETEAKVILTLLIKLIIGETDAG
jgi:Guanine nucleotide exchange factor in Golgi transport N-terminal